MQLARALETLQRQPPPGGSVLSVSLACGFEPLHFGTLLAAELSDRLPGTRIKIASGQFDDLPGNVARGGRSDADVVAVVIEWSDLDPRLGLRRLGGWRVADLAGVAADSARVLAQLERELMAAAGAKPIVCCLPTLALPPLFAAPPARSDALELALGGHVGRFAARLADHPGVAIVSAQRLAELSPAAERRDVRAELETGFPYTVEHAAAVAAMLAELSAPRPPRKGVITDLDGTLWAGTLDERGADGVSWTGDAHRHGVYQQMLASLASAGILVAVASRNDPGTVAEALARPDLVITADVIFPIEARWGLKTESIARILDAWNIAADAVVYVDDSPLELDAAARAFPGLETVAMPDDADGVWALLDRLRSLCGKAGVTPEDRLRLPSIRSAGAYRRAQQPPGSSAEDFLARVDGTVTFSRATARPDRALELIHKSNQFNLNGRRQTRAELMAGVAGGDRELITVNYADRYGALGLIAVLLIGAADDALVIDTWVMSCRAFARRIEHHTLSYLFDTFAVPAIVLSFEPTARNQALSEFLVSVLGEDALAAGPDEDRALRLTRAGFEQHSPALVHRVVTEGG